MSPVNSSTKVTIFRPDSKIHDSYFKAICCLISEVWRFRSHTRVVFKEQFKAAAYGTGLGIVWNYLLPLLPLTVYWILSSFHVFERFEGVDRGSYITFGLTLWFFLVGCLQVPMQIVQNQNHQSMKTAFPLISSVVAGFAQLLFDSLVRLSLVSIVIISNGAFPSSWNVMFLPALLIPAFLFFVGLGLWLSILNVIYRDVSRIINIFLQYMIFLSGVIFPLDKIEVVAFINQFNPFAIYIQFSRGWFFNGMADNVENYLVASVLALLFFCVGARTFYVMEYRIRGAM